MVDKASKTEEGSVKIAQITRSLLQPRWAAWTGILLLGVGALFGFVTARWMDDAASLREDFRQERQARYRAEERAKLAEETLKRLEREERARLEQEKERLLAIRLEQEKKQREAQEVVSTRQEELSDDMGDPAIEGRPQVNGVDMGANVAPNIAMSSSGSNGLSDDAREWRSKYRYAALKYNRLVANYDRLQKKYIELVGADGGKRGIVTGSMFYRVLRKSTREELNAVERELNGGVSTRRVREVQLHKEALEERELWLRKKAREVGIE